METKEVLQKLRRGHGWSQDELAEKVFVTRQAVSRWETGETVPNIESLRLLSALFGVSINTLLGSPQKLYCQCCGMPLEDEVMSREPDGAINEEYCKWCYADGKFAYASLEAQVRANLEEMLPRLRHWQAPRADAPENCAKKK